MSVLEISERTPRRPDWVRTLCGAAALLAATTLVGQRTLARLNVPGKPLAKEWGLVDFRDAVYYPAVAVLEGVNPYDTERYRAAYPVGNLFPVYAPFTPYLHAPLALLPYETAELAYCCLVVALTLLLARLCLAFAGLTARPGDVMLLAALAFVARPGHLNFVLGQMGVQSALASLAALHFARTRPNLSGLCLALATYKPTFGAPLAVLMLLRRDFRAVAVGVVVGGLLTAAGMALVMATCGGWRQFWDALPGNMQALSNDPLASPLLGWMRIDAQAGVARLMGQEPSPLVCAVTSAAVLALGGLSIWRLGNGSRAVGADSLSTAIICLTVSTVVYHLLYDLLFLLGPATALFAGRRSEWRALGSLRRAGLAALMLVPFGNLLLTNAGIAQLERGGLAWTAVTSVNSVALIGALLWCCVLAWQSDKRPGQTVS